MVSKTLFLLQTSQDIVFRGPPDHPRRQTVSVRPAKDRLRNNTSDGTNDIQRWYLQVSFPRMDFFEEHPEWGNPLGTHLHPFVGAAGRCGGVELGVATGRMGVVKRRHGCILCCEVGQPCGPESKASGLRGRLQHVM